VPLCTEKRTERNGRAARFQPIPKKVINVVTRRVTTANQVRPLPFGTEAFLALITASNYGANRSSSSRASPTARSSNACTRRERTPATQNAVARPAGCDPSSDFDLPGPAGSRPRPSGYPRRTAGDAHGPSARSRPTHARRPDRTSRPTWSAARDNGHRHRVDRITSDHQPWGVRQGTAVFPTARPQAWAAPVDQASQYRSVCEGDSPYLCRYRAANLPRCRKP
jgi:hypothetical protein